MPTLNELQTSLNRELRDRAIFEQARSYACDYMDALPDRPVFPPESAIAALANFDESLPETPGNGAQLLELLHRCGSPATVAQTGGRYFGFVNGGILPPVLAAKWLADTWDQNPALYVISPVAAHLEMLCERWLVALFGLPETTCAGLVSGTSMATFCGLATGRDTLLSRQGWDIHDRGLFGAPELKVVVGAEAHATVYKALSFLGLGRERVIRVPVDDQGCILPAALPELDGSTLLVLQAGNVNTGGFDPFRPLCRKARAAGAWVHIDGAFGLWAAGSAATRHLTDGIDLADSWSVDAHKTLNAPYDNGIVLCRDRAALIRAMQANGSYITYGDQRDSMLFTPEMSRRARGVELWATLKILGRTGIDALVSGLCGHARRCAELLAARGFRIRNRIDFNQVLVACDSPEMTTATLQQLQRSGSCWCGASRWRDEPVIRLSVCSWATTERDIEITADAFTAARLRAEGRQA